MENIKEMIRKMIEINGLTSGTAAMKKEAKDYETILVGMAEHPEKYRDSFAKEAVHNMMRINAAIENTKRLQGVDGTGVTADYWDNTKAQRVIGEKTKGSAFIDMNEEELETFVKYSLWREKKHPNVFPFCTAFVTESIPNGMYGVMPLSELDDDVELVILDQKNTGYASLCVKGGMRVPAKETWLILGPCDTGEEVVFTFHPGEPTKPAKTSTDKLPVGTPLTKAKAIAEGFDSANIL